MTKHTPGPWAFDEDDMSVSAAVGVHICTVSAASNFPCLDPDEDDTEKVEAECRANAHLISAAPEMLAVLTYGPSLALPEFLEWVANRLVNVHREPDGIDFVASLRERARIARAAIAKAEGRAP